VAAKRVGPKGAVVAIDLLPMEPISGVTVLMADFASDEGVDAVGKNMARKADVVLSDMAPNMSGIAMSDQARSMELAEIARDFAQLHLKAEGVFIVKVFQGAGYDEYLRSLRAMFGKVVARKPASSRGESSEQYLLARGVKPLK
jgi:23S rRNA (uridine2552-2'-O)-methyltransferase